MAQGLLGLLGFSSKRDYSAKDIQTLREKRKGNKKGKAEKEYIFTLKGKPVTEQAFIKWQKSIGEGRWKPEKIKQLQKKFGLEETGEWTTDLADIQRTYFEARETYGKEPAIKTIREEIAKQRLGAGEAEVDERQNLKNSMTDWWAKLFGVLPDESNLNWAAGSAEAGWSNLDMYNWLKQTPSFQQRYYGMPDNMAPDTYDSGYQKLNSAWLQSRGKQLTKDEYARILRGEKIPRTSAGFEMPESVS